MIGPRDSRRALRAMFLVACGVLLSASSLHAQLQAQPVASGFSAPVAFVQDPLFANAFYIVEQGGLVKALVDGQLQGAPFLDLRGAIASGGERGLLGLAFSPDARSGRVFVNFTNTAGDTVVARFRRSAGSPFRADPASRFDLLWPGGERVIRQPFANHNGGHLEFGADGRLYVGLGDGGSGNDPLNHAQNPLSLLGKMLRLDVSVDDSDAVGYRVPPDNPFVDGSPISALAEIWSFGLRNPWRYTFDTVGPSATGALFIADVGQGAREEINIEPSGQGGRNYGWRLREGRIPTPGVPGTAAAFEPLIDPQFEYGRSSGQAITGGYVYRGSALGPAYFGRYFFADYVTSRVWSLGWTWLANSEAAVTDVIEHTGELGGGLGGIASFGRDRDGELYIVTFAGRIWKMARAVGAAPPPQNLTATVDGQAVTLSWTPPASRISAYQLEAGSVPGAANLVVATIPGIESSLTFGNVPVGTYYVRVRSVSGTTPGAPSNERVVVVGAAGAGCAGPPSPPFSLAAVVSGRTVTLQWASPVTASAAQVILEAGSAPALADLTAITMPGGTTTLTVQAPPGNYFVRVRATNACGTSASSNELLVSVM